MVSRNAPLQESFMVIGQANQEIVSRNFVDETPELSVSIIERNVHLQNVLSLLGQISMRGGFTLYAHGGPHDLQERYGEMTGQVVRGARANQQIMMNSAKWEFARASGLFAMIEAEPEHASRHKDQVAHAFAQFRTAYGPAHHSQDRVALRHKLEHNNAILRDSVTAHNRALGLRPHKKTNSSETPELPTLDTPNRLRAINEDPRAGFLPTTNTEKNRVLAFLDYLDNPAYKMGINNQFWEIANHQERNRNGSRNPNLRGPRAMESIVYELGDYLANATTSLAGLRDLEVQLSGIHPSIPLAEETELDGQPGLATLGRFVDLRDVQREKPIEGIKDPLLTRTRRWTKDGPGQHKAIEDRYTGSQPDYAGQAIERVKSLKAKDARKVLGSAITDQEKRQEFFALRLREIVAASESPIDRPHVAAARAILQKLDLAV
jgi:hypothetical protein